MLYTPKRFTIMWGGGLSSTTTQCAASTWMMLRLATGQRHQCAHHTPATGGEEERVIEPIKCMRSPHTSYRWRGERVIDPIKCMRSPNTSYRGERRESHRANQVYALTTNQLQVERRESHKPIKCMRSPHTSYRWRRERES